MNRAEKLKALQDVFQGQYRLLQQLHREERKKSMPFLDAHAVVNIRQCSPLLLDLLVMPTESLIDGKRKDYIPLKDYLRRFDKVDPNGPCYTYSAIGSIDGNDSRFDSVPLDCIQLQHRNYSNSYVSGKTIADLRYFFNQSVSSLEEHPFILLLLETNITRYDFATQPHATI